MTVDKATQRTGRGSPALAYARGMELKLPVEGRTRSIWMVLGFLLLSICVLSGCDLGLGCGDPVGPNDFTCERSPVVRIPCTSVSWVVEVRNGLDLNADPPQVLLKVGQNASVLAVPVNLRPVGCKSPDPTYTAAFTSADPGIAAIRYLGNEFTRSASVDAVAPGDTTIFATDLPGQPASSRAELAYCRDWYGDCTPLRLILRVIP